MKFFYLKLAQSTITIIGDSMLNGIYEEGMQKDHNVKVKPHSGATSRDIIDYLKPVVRKSLAVLLFMQERMI